MINQDSKIYSGSRGACDDVPIYIIYLGYSTILNFHICRTVSSCIVKAYGGHIANIKDKEHWDKTHI